MIIDVHCHLGWDRVFDEEFTKEALLEKHEKTGVSVSIVQPATCHDLESVRRQHDAVHALTRAYPGQFYGMANVNPHLDDAAYEAETRRCVQELGFVGIKLHPQAHAVNPSSRDGRKVFALAQQLQVPVLIHTGGGIPFANPALMLDVAQEFAQVKMVLSHCGQFLMASEMPLILGRCENVYADSSWTGGFMLKRWSEQFGYDRIMMATDHADNAATEIAKIRSIFTGEQAERILCGNARAVFGI